MEPTTHPPAATRPQTKLETCLSVQAPLEERRQTLTDLREGDRPDTDTMAAVAQLLHDEDESMREMAGTLLRVWGQPALSVVLQTLRSCEPLDVPQRLALIQYLGSWGPEAMRAETLLRSMENDPNVGEAASQAIRDIRRDGGDLLGRFGDWGVELFLLSATVATPMVSMRWAKPNLGWPPAGIAIGIGALAVFGLLMARYVYADDLLPERESPEVRDAKRRMNYFLVAGVGTAVGVMLTGLMCVAGGFAQGLFR